MKKNSGYMDRALRARDPRFARVLSKLGYGRRDMQAAPVAVAPPKHDEITLLRAEYERVIGKRPFMGWDEYKLREKIAEVTK